ncbi:MAG: DUF2911 domain-containing protein [Acidobacteriales bacterium]|nr:DUF2911 domain-containing protein [Terriglobales bacterium]
MKQAIAVVMVLMLSGTVFSQELSELATPPNGDNERAEVAQWIGPVKISIEYHSPRVHNPSTNDRTGHIWGELVHYGFFDEGLGPTRGAPWRAGANESTSITVSNDVKVEGKYLKAGKYALFLDVEKNGPWTWVFSNHIGWGSYQYDPKYDVLRVPVTAQDVPFTEFLTYGFDDRQPGGALAYLQWEKKRIPFKIEVANVNDLYVAKMRQDLESWGGFRNEDWQTAAQFCADNKINLEEALTWADKAIRGPFRGATLGQENFTNLQTKAAVLAAMGRQSEADVVMQKALHLPGNDPGLVYAYGMSLLGAKNTAKAMEVFLLNQRQHPEEKYWTSLGLARGYTATADKKNAIANWEIVLHNVPPTFSNRTPAFEAALKKLKESS